MLGAINDSLVVCPSAPIYGYKEQQKASEAKAHVWLVNIEELEDEIEELDDDAEYHEDELAWGVEKLHYAENKVAALEQENQTSEIEMAEKDARWVTVRTVTTLQGKIEEKDVSAHSNLGSSELDWSERLCCVRPRWLDFALMEWRASCKGPG